MRRTFCSLALAVSMLTLSGCRTKGPEIPSQPANRSLVDMQAEYAKLRMQYVADCISGTPEHVRANNALCETESKKMAPLGNAIGQALQAQGRHQ